MNLVLTYCHKEWRAQRGVLIAYTLLVFACLSIGFSLVPEYWWLEDGRGALALSWFVAAGVIGVVAFATPALVRAEYAAKDDQFVRRLPGALLPAFGGKVLFLVLATAALPLLGLLVGELVLEALGQSWSDLWGTRWSMVEEFEVFLRLPWTVPAGAAALLLTSWVWAVGTWMPSGRMAIGGAALLTLSVGVVLFAVRRQCPDIEHGLSPAPWLVALVVSGLLVAGASWVRGRRGGGALRSARFGVLSCAALFAAPGIWLGERVHSYLRPDLADIKVTAVIGVTADHRFALVYGAASTDWHGVPLRVDLQTGRAEQLGDWTTMFSAGFFGEDDWYWPGVGRRHWRTAGEDLTVQRLFDLQSGAFAALEVDATTKLPRLTEGLRADLRTQSAATADLRGPDGQAIWAEGNTLVLAERDGTTTTVVLPGGTNPRFSCGHGLRNLKGGLFDLTHRKALALRGKWYGFAVRGLWVLRSQPSAANWQRFDAGTDTMLELPELAGCSIWGLFDDEHLLCERRSSRGSSEFAELLLYRPADRSLEALAVVPEARCAHVLSERMRWGSLLPRDPSGRIWLHDRDDAARCLVVSPDRSVQVLERPLPKGATNGLITWTSPDHALVLLGWRIVDLNLLTGAQTVLFPKEEP